MGNTQSNIERVTADYRLVYVCVVCGCVSEIARVFCIKFKLSSFFCETSFSSSLLVLVHKKLGNKY